MGSTKDLLPAIVTRGRESTSLEYGPQRIHYVYSTALPQAYLTLFSILQGLAFSILLIGFPLPQTLTMPALYNFALQQYFYLPYLFSISLLIIIWIFLANVSLIGNWPHNFLQVSLVVLLTLCEILAFRAISTLALWLALIGGCHIIGGAILMRTSLLESNDDYDPSPPFQEWANYIIKWEYNRGLFYIFVGIGLIVLASSYVWILPLLQVNFALLSIIIPWAILLTLIILLLNLISDVNDDVDDIKKLLKNTDLTMSRAGVLRYKKRSHEQTLLETSTQDNVSSSDSGIHQSSSLYYLLRFALVASAAMIVVFGYLLNHKKSKNG